MQSVKCKISNAKWSDPHRMGPEPRRPDHFALPILHFTFCIPKVCIPILALASIGGSKVWTSQAPPLPNQPDLDVTAIGISPRYPAFAPRDVEGVPQPTNPETGQVISPERAARLRHALNPGEMATFTARVVNHGGTASGPFHY